MTLNQPRTNAQFGSEQVPFSTPAKFLVVSFASLFIEVMLIRWVGTEFRLFAYIQNLTLIACFLGFGLGCLQASHKPPHDLFNFRTLSLLVLIIEVPWNNWKVVLDVLVSGLSVNSDLSVWALPDTGIAAAAGFLVAAAVVSTILLLIIATMIPLGAWVAGFLEDSRDRVIPAYTINLVGSLLGVWAFAGISFLHLAPIFWFLFIFALLFTLRPRLKEIGLSGFLILAACLLYLVLGGRPQGTIVWSPYQKLELVPFPHQNYQINVNNSGYMSIANLTPENLASDPELARRYANGNSYDSPYHFLKTVGDVLVVGGGAGNDVAAALRNGARHVDAVEIDPVIYGFGRDLHPENPYGSPKVRVILDDARDYMRRSASRYDLIVFGLLDSHTQSSSLSNVRIDNYVYTDESFQDAKRLLKPSGILVVKFEVREPHTWMGQRFYAMLQQTFSHPPVVFYCPQVQALFSASVFLESQDPSLWERASASPLAEFVAAHPVSYALPGDTRISTTTDDWPYLYHRGHSIPTIYLSVSAILLGLAVILVRKNFPYRRALTWQFFFLGAGFLLLETQMVSRLSLYFGSTWLVNCFALSFILLMLVVANIIVELRKIISLMPLYGLLVAALIAIYALPWAQLPYGTRTVGLLLCAAFSVPLLFAGIIFAETFRRAGGNSSVFGSNILGAVAGGLAQNLSFILGMKALLLVAALFYAVAGLASLFGVHSESIAGRNLEQA